MSAAVLCSPHHRAFPLRQCLGREEEGGNRRECDAPVSTPAAVNGLPFFAFTCSAVERLGASTRLALPNLPAFPRSRDPTPAPTSDAAVVAMAAPVDASPVLFGLQHTHRPTHRQPADGKLPFPPNPDFSPSIACEALCELVQPASVGLVWHGVCTVITCPSSVAELASHGTCGHAYDWVVDAEVNTGRSNELDLCAVRLHCTAPVCTPRPPQTRLSRDAAQIPETRERPHGWMQRR